MNLFRYKIVFIILLFVLNVDKSRAQLKWLAQESEHFKLIYLWEHADLASHILYSAEKALKPLSEIFNYSPTEKIVINIYDINDYGQGSATTVPQNIIRLSIEPFEPGYENMLYTERFHWLLTHELVHIVVNDQSTELESIIRSLFSKVPPEQIQPSSILFSILTNYSRYTPRWYQEGIAVYLETWFNGGFGRALSNFDEMYFRTLVYDNKKFPQEIDIETIYTHNSYLLGTINYFIGTRFISYLSIKYSPEQVFKWYITDKDKFFEGIDSRFEDIFGLELATAWQNFINYEIDFQGKNIKRIQQYEVTPLRYITNEAQGWVTQAQQDENGNLIFGSHKSHKLSVLEKLDVKTGVIDEISSIPTPSMYQVASITLNKNLGHLFYTTNNNLLYRDVWLYNLGDESRKLLFENFRVGNLSVSQSTHELWGVEHSGGYTTLVYSAFPYEKFVPVLKFNIGQELNQLSVSPSGKYLAAVLHKDNGTQALIAIETDKLLSDGKATYKTLSTDGSPENPSWSIDGNYIYWNAYTNGVSNIYRIDLSDGDIKAMSHTIRGLFRPLQISEDTLFAFEYSTEGFIPVLLANKEADYLPAVNYYGQQIVEKNPELASLNIPGLNDNDRNLDVKYMEYDAFSNLDVNSFVPVVSGFQSQKVLGLFARISDPMLIHDLTVEVGVSPFNENPVAPKFHLLAKYNYNRRIHFSFSQNAPDFYDLFNNRKRGMIGRKITLGHTHYWKYDHPNMIKQNSEIAFYNGVEFINDNLVRVSRPDFFVAQTNYNSSNLRRTIGSSDFEHGDLFDITFRVFGDNPDNPQFAAQVHGEWDNVFNFLVPHNTIHLKLSAGYHNDNPDLIQSRFYFGGFGNRAVENVDVKQYRKVFRFPGIPIYSLDTDRFVKVMLENNLPPLRFSNLAIGQHLINHLDVSVYSQAMLIRSPIAERWIDVGAQMNLVFKHWFNLESTFSAGIAKAWSENSSDWEWFASIKLLKN